MRFIITSLCRLSIDTSASPKICFLEWSQYIRDTLTKWRSNLVEFSGESDHIHLVIETHPSLNLSQLVANLISESNLPNTWNKKDIGRGIDYYANQFRLNLSYRVKEYLELALNNNFPLLSSGLETLALLSLNPSLELTKETIPSVHATAIELKEMILACRRGDIPEYLARLKAIADERVILASLKTQFTILMQTAIGNSQHLSDSDIARLAEINNPKRLYYIRKELTQISLKQLIWLNQQIRDTQYQLKYCNCDLCGKLMMMCCWSAI